MKKIISFFFFLFSFFFSVSQNLVPNYSFEDTTQCPFDGGQISFAPPWYSPTLGTTDYFKQCGLAGFVGVPSNVRGFQFARTGDAYISFAAYGASSGFTIREYAQVQLLDTLIQDITYCVSFYVSHTGYNPTYAPIAITQIGLLLSNNPITSSNDQPLAFTPQIVSPVGVYLNDTTLWTEIWGTYTALGGERFITIGNFKDDASTDTIIIANPGLDPQGYYYVDDVSVIDCDSLVGVIEYENSSLFNIFPNPNDGEMNLEYTIKSKDRGEVNIYDITGKLVDKYILNPNNDYLLINTTLNKGIYLYQIIVNDNMVKSDKIVIIH